LRTAGSPAASSTRTAGGSRTGYWAAAQGPQHGGDGERGRYPTRR
jgi:hypothetical protein